MAEANTAREATALASSISDEQVTSTETFISKDTKTKMKTHNTVMLDCGSRVNVVGAKTYNDYRGKWEACGLTAKIIPRKTMLKISGVGNGYSLCKQEAQFPLAVDFDGVASLETMQANIAEGPGGDHLPCILGLDSMTNKNAVLLLHKGERRLALPGPGGYKIEWSPGTKLLPLENLPSGHLGFISDNYDKAKNNHSEQLSFVTDHTTVTSSSSSSNPK